MAEVPLDVGLAHRTYAEAFLARACTDRGAVGRDDAAPAALAGTPIASVSVTSATPVNNP